MVVKEDKIDEKADDIPTAVSTTLQTVDEVSGQMQIMLGDRFQNRTW
jgi:hypothetical protein